MDIEELKKWLREKKLFQPTGVEAADTIESLQSELAAVRQELEEARKDGPRLLIACAGFDGYTTDTKDKYDYACAVAQERGHDEPTTEDEIEGLRRMVDNYAARQQTS